VLQLFIASVVICSWHNQIRVISILDDDIAAVYRPQVGCCDDIRGWAYCRALYDTSGNASEGRHFTAEPSTVVPTREKVFNPVIDFIWNGEIWQLCKELMMPDAIKCLGEVNCKDRTRLPKSINWCKFTSKRFHWILNHMNFVQHNMWIIFMCLVLFCQNCTLFGLPSKFCQLWPTKIISYRARSLWLGLRLKRSVEFWWNLFGVSVTKFRDKYAILSLPTRRWDVAPAYGHINQLIRLCPLRIQCYTHVWGKQRLSFNQWQTDSQFVKSCHECAYWCAVFSVVVLRTYTLLLSFL